MWPFKDEYEYPLKYYLQQFRVETTQVSFGGKVRKQNGAGLHGGLSLDRSGMLSLQSEVKKGGASRHKGLYTMWFRLDKVLDE